MSDLIDVYLQGELRIVNKHIPRKRLTLCQLLSMEIPYVVTSDGGIHIFDPRELDYLAKITNRNCLLELPIIIEYIPQEREGLYIIRSPLEAEVVAKILGISPTHPLFLHRSEILELRRKLRTTSTILLNPSEL